MAFYDVLGAGQIPAGLLSDQERQSLNNQALINSGLALMAASRGGQPGTGRVGLAGALQQGLQAGQGTYAGAFQNAQNQASFAQKQAEYAQKQEALKQQQAIQDLIASPEFRALPRAEQYQKLQDVYSGFDAATADKYSQMAERLKPAKVESIYGKVDPKDYTPASLKLFSQSGNYADLVPRPNATGAQPYYQAIPTSSGYMRFNARTGQMEAVQGPSGTPIMGPQYDPALQADIVRAKKVGEAQGGAEGQVAIQTLKAPENAKILDQAETLLSTATGSGAGKLRDASAAFLGKSTEGAQSAAKLKVLAAKMVMQVPRMEGPQSDRDTELYREAAGNLADDSLPGETRAAALQTMRLLNNKYLNVGQNPKPSGSILNQADNILKGGR